MPRDDLGELTALADGHKEQVARDVLTSLGIDVLQQQGDELIIACPVSAYHKDQQRNPTAALNYSKLLFNCLGCGTGGTILWLIATLQDTTVEHARDWLNGEAGLSRAMDLPDLLAMFDSLYTETRRTPLPYYSDKMLSLWFWDHIPTYITGTRRIPEETARRMGVATDVEGLIAKVPRGPRAVIPHRWQGKLVGWQSRRLPDADPGSPKYYSTPGFPREETLYNFPETSGLRRYHRGHGVESPMSSLRHMHHVEHLVASFGDVITDRQIQLIGDTFDEFVWWPDPDEGGWRTVEGRDVKGRHFPGMPEKLSARCRVYVVESPYDGDIADLEEDVVETLFGRAVPWQIWQRPLELRCHRCLRPSHPGERCAGAQPASRRIVLYPPSSH
ncbi:hypothetical protein ACFZAM_31450 [Streptomyces sp. NPDC008079]|uniref:hypothetical protein n=1 Tax=Streptomyces sp. NPDC008079 TaxID=3364806 RepID=UPI0036E36162